MIFKCISITGDCISRALSCPVFSLLNGVAVYEITYITKITKYAFPHMLYCDMLYIIKK